ncbi:MAG: sensor histidine kinase, partial [Nitrospirales bacterium]
LHSERDKEGIPVPDRPLVKELLTLNPVDLFQVLYREGRIYETRLPLMLNNVPFGTIRLGIATSLLRKEVNTALAHTLKVAGFILPVAWLVALGLATLTLRPLRKLTRDVERLRRGEFMIDADPVRDDEFGELASQLQDLGQQLQADNLKVLSQKNQIQHVVDHLEDAILFLNKDRQVLYYNKATEALLGKSLEQALGWPLEGLIDPSHPLRPMLEQALMQKTGFRNAAITLVQDGKSKEYMVSTFVIMADDQRAMGAVVFLKDLESVRTFQSLISYSAKLTALGRLTSGIAHEVKNPLNAMMIHLELLKEQLDGTAGPVQQSLEVIGSEIRRLDRVVQGFLKFIRPQELSLKPVDLNALL